MMALGWNLLVSSYWNTVPTHSNLLKQADARPRPPGEWFPVVNSTIDTSLQGQTLYGLLLDGLEFHGLTQIDPPVPIPGFTAWRVTGEIVMVRYAAGWTPKAPGPVLTPAATEFVTAAMGLNPHLRAVLAASPGPVRVMDLCGPFTRRGVDAPSHPFSVTGYDPAAAVDGWGDQLGWSWDEIAALDVPDLYMAIPTLVDNVKGATAAGSQLGKALHRRKVTRFARVGYANEVWNPGSRIRRYVEQLDPVLDQGPGLEVALAERYVVMAAPLVNAFAQALKDEAPEIETQRVCEWWHAVPWAFQLDQWNGMRPVSQLVRSTVQTMFDAIAVAPYVGEGSLAASPSDERLQRDLDQAISRSAVWAEIADQLDKPLVGYEGGFHYLGKGGVQWHSDPRAETWMLKYLQAMSSFYSALCLYGLGGPPNSEQHGSWSHVASPAEYVRPSPRLRGAARFLGVF